MPLIWLAISMNNAITPHFQKFVLKWPIVGPRLKIFWLRLEQIFALIFSKPIFGASALEQILRSAEREICSNTTIGQPWFFIYDLDRCITYEAGETAQSTNFFVTHLWTFWESKLFLWCNLSITVLLVSMTLQLLSGLQVAPRQIIQFLNDTC